MGASEDLPTSAAAATHPDFALYEIARFFIVAGLEMQSVAVGWQVYEITHRALDLGLVGLAQFLPGVLLFLVAGHAADRHDRRRLLNICYSGFIVCSLLLLALTVCGWRSVHLIYVVLLVLGVVRCFNWPASRALLPQLVPMEYFSKAVAWNASVFQAATILGPAVGGILYALTGGPAAVYASSAVLSAIALLATLRIRSKSQARPAEEMTLSTMMAGFHYVWREKVVLGSISLDMFAVLLGGAVALLPVYASEILKTGPWGLGLLRSAPGVGAALMAIFLARRPIRGRAGMIMLGCVAGFGVFTILFGVSRSVMLSLVALLLVGATDMVSVIIRATLVQVATPDAMRGRVNAVDMLFIGASNELGEFESGLTAHWFGTVPAVVLGGVGTLCVIGLWAWLFPELRNADQLHPAKTEPVA
ncbi:MAG TPA: MFS transporter [Terriglobales bacterium]|jgi:MFS family permease|nr:MFS transporter [Terriglobales bacterium]